MIDPRPVQPAAADDAQETGPPIRVLVADDSPGERLLLRLVLEERGEFTVIGEAANGREAVALAQRDQPDVVLLDIAMPDVDGLEAAPEIRRLTPETKIVVLSAYSSTRMGEQARAAGADAYIEKSAPRESLLVTIGEVCPHPARVAPAPVVLPVITDRGRADVDADTLLLHRSLLDALEEGIVVVDSQGIVQSANFSATLILGMPTSRLVGHALGGLGLVLDDQSGTGLGAVSDNPIAAALATGRPASAVTLRLVRDDVPLRYLLVSVRPLTRPGATRPHLAIASLVDITQIRQVEERFRAIIEAMPRGILILSAVRDEAGRIIDFRFEDANQAAIDVSGRPVKELIGRRILELYPTASGMVDAYGGVFESGETLLLPAVRFDYTSEGKPMSLVHDIHVGRFGDGCIVTYTDVTAREQALQELATLRAELQRRDNADRDI